MLKSLACYFSHLRATRVALRLTNSFFEVLANFKAENIQRKF